MSIISQYRLQFATRFCFFRSSIILLGSRTLPGILYLVLNSGCSGTSDGSSLTGDGFMVLLMYAVDNLLSASSKSRKALSLLPFRCLMLGLKSSRLLEDHFSTVQGMINDSTE